MAKKEVLRVEHVGMKFNLSQEKVDDLKDYIIKLIKGQLKYNEFWALKDINFTLRKGDRLGILGLNGAGKSTLLKVIAGVLKPSEGSVATKGKIAPLLELGAGFDQQYTGRENIYLYGAVLGFSKKFLDEKFDEIVEFSELGRFIDVPVKNYSSGMKSRLGFSVATLVEPDILILDEVLSVGDAKFRRKSEAKIMSMFDKGVTVLFVSHSLEQVKRLCNKAILLEKGQIISSGSIEEVSTVYEEKNQVNTGRYLMKKVITYGTFDLLHAGHINLLRRAKELGDYLIVVVSTDEFNWNEKRKKCYFSYEERKKLVEAVRYVDLVIPENNWEQKVSDVQEYHVDTFVMGDDWVGKFDFLKEYCDVVYLPRTEGISTTKIKQDLGLVGKQKEED